MVGSAIVLAAWPQVFGAGAGLTTGSRELLPAPLLAWVVWGLLLLTALLFLVFQAVFSWANVPMDANGTTLAGLINQVYPDLKIILSHAGGFLPYAAERVARICSPR